MLARAKGVRRVLTRTSADAQDASATKVWKGPDQGAGDAAFVFALRKGERDTGALLLAQFASFPDAWGFAETFASAINRSRRTVQRYVARFKAQGWMFSKRGRDGETPPNAQGPLSCGFTHRWVVGRKLAGTARENAVAAARATQVQRMLARDEITNTLARRLGLPRAVRHLGAAATIAWTLTKPPERPPEQRAPDKSKITGTRAEIQAKLDAELARRPPSSLVPHDTKPRDGPA